MLIAAIVLMSVSIIVTGSTTYLEWRQRDSVWKLFMKIGPCLFGVGGILFGLGMVG